MTGRTLDVWQCLCTCTYYCICVSCVFPVTSCTRYPSITSRRYCTSNYLHAIPNFPIPRNSPVLFRRSSLFLVASDAPVPTSLTHLHTCKPHFCHLHTVISYPCTFFFLRLSFFELKIGVGPARCFTSIASDRCLYYLRSEQAVGRQPGRRRMEDG